MYQSPYKTTQLQEQRDAKEYRETEHWILQSTEHRITGALQTSRSYAALIWDVQVSAIRAFALACQEECRAVCPVSAR